MALSLAITNSSSTPVSLCPSAEPYAPYGDIPAGATVTFALSGNAFLTTQAPDTTNDPFLGPAAFFHITDLGSTKLPWHGPGPRPDWAIFEYGATLYPVKQTTISPAPYSDTYYCRFRVTSTLAFTITEDLSVHASSITTTPAAGAKPATNAPVLTTMDIHVESHGLQDGNRAVIQVGGVDVFSLNLPGSPNKPGRGMNVALINKDTGAVVDVRVFDTHGKAADATALTKYLNGMREGDMVIIAAMDSASDKLISSVKNAIKSLGSILIDKLAFRGSWAIIGRVGATLGVVPEDLKANKKGFVTLDSQGVSFPLPTVRTNESKTVDIHVESHGLHDGNNAIIQVGGVDVFSLDIPGSPNKPGRGMNVALINKDTGAVVDVRVFDTHGKASDATALLNYLNDVRKGDMVVMAAKDSANNRLTVRLKNAIKNLGSTLIDKLGYRGSWAIIGRSGAEPGTVKEDLKANKKGFVTLDSESVSFPLDAEEATEPEPLKLVHGAILGEVGAPDTYIDVAVESKGAEDGDTATITVQGEDVFSLNIPGQATKTNRGMNVAVVNQVTGSVEDVKVFDTYAALPTKFTALLNSVAVGRIVIIAINDEGSSKLNESAKQAIERLGSRLIRKVQFRDSWCIVGQVGAETGTVKEVYTPKKKGTAAINTRLSLQTLVANGISVGLASAAKAYGNFSKIWIDGVEVPGFSNEDGLNVAVVSTEGVISDSQAFNTGKDISASSSFSNWVDNLPFGTCVAVSVKNEASESLTLKARKTLGSLGARKAEEITYGSSYALIGFKGAAVGTVAESLNPFSSTQVAYTVIPEMIGGVAGIYGQSEGFAITMESSQNKNYGISRIAVDNVAVGSTLPGINVVAIDPSSGIVVESHNYNTVESAEEADKLADFLNELETGMLVALSMLHGGSSKLTKRSKDAIYSIGSRFVYEVKPEWSWVVFGRKGAAPGSAIDHYMDKSTDPICSATWFRANGGTQNSFFDISASVGALEDGPGGVIKLNGAPLGEKASGLRMAVFDEETGRLIENKSWDLYFYAEQTSTVRRLINCKDSCIVAICQQDDANKELRSRYSGPDETPVGSRSSWVFVGRADALDNSDSSPMVTSGKSPCTAIYRLFTTKSLRDIPAHDVWLRSPSQTESSVYMNINGKAIDLTSTPGMHVAVLEANGDVASSQTFDIAGDASSSDKFADLIDSLDEFTIAAVTVSGGTSEKLSERAQSSLESIGSSLVRTLANSSSWALIGSKGNVRGGAVECVLSNGPVGVSADMPYLKPSGSGENTTSNYLMVSLATIPSDRYYAQFLDTSSNANVARNGAANQAVSEEPKRRALLMSSRTPTKTRPELEMSADRVLFDQRRYLANTGYIGGTEMRVISRAEGLETTKTTVLSEMRDMVRFASVEDEVLFIFIGYSVTEAGNRRAIKVWEDDERTKQVLLYDDEIASTVAKYNKNLKFSCVIGGRFDGVAVHDIPTLIADAVDSAEEETVTSSEQLEVRVRAANFCNHPDNVTNLYGNTIADVSRFLRCVDSTDVI